MLALRSVGIDLIERKVLQFLCLPDLSRHQATKAECALKSPVKNIAKGFSVLMFEYKVSNFDRKSNIRCKIYIPPVFMISSRTVFRSPRRYVRIKSNVIVWYKV